MFKHSFLKNKKNMTKILDYFGVLKFYINLTPQAKSVVATLLLIIGYLGYSNYSLNNDLKSERLRYDKLSDKYKNESDILRKENSVFYKDLLEEYKQRTDALEKKIKNYESK